MKIDKYKNEKNKKSGKPNSMPLTFSGGIICGPIWGSFAVGGHLRRCTGIIQGTIALQLTHISLYAVSVYDSRGSTMAVNDGCHGLRSRG